MAYSKDTPAGGKPPARKAAPDDLDMSAVRARYSRAVEHAKDNARDAYDDLDFRSGDGQWPTDLRQQREKAGRPALVVNRVPQFIRQVTGDIRQMRPAIRVYGVDDKADKHTAEAFQDVIRYIEARSDATDAYFRAVDQQVTAGIGHWRVSTEFAFPDSQLQEIRIEAIDDGVGVLWDPASTSATRHDANYCFVPVDMPFDEFKERYPDAKASEFDSLEGYVRAYPTGSWAEGDTIRVAEYWLRKPKKVRALGPDGDEVERETFEVCSYIVTGTDVLEGPREWPSRFIPVVPVIGEEIRIGKRTFRHGVTRFLKDPQRRYNVMASAQVEIVSTQPKAPYLATEKQIGEHLDLWQRANSDNMPFLLYKPDAGAPPPQRIQPPVSSQGIAELMAVAAEDMKAVTGIYDAALGMRSNETSGKAILARQQEGDVGTFVYVDNFMRALRQTGRILVDLIPKIYDTTRVMRIIGEDGAVNEIEVNKPVIANGVTAMMNDLTVGTYDVTVESGPSYSTKRAEARDGMQAFMQAFPAAGPVIADLVAKAQDWPNADKFAERLRALLPPQIAQMEAQEAGEGMGGAPVQPPAPPPEVIAEQVAQEVMAGPDFQLKAAQARKAMAEAQKAELELQATAGAMTAPIAQPGIAPTEEPMPQPDPIEAIQHEVMKKRALMQIDLEAETYRKRLEAQMARAQTEGVNPDDVLPVESGPSPIEMLAQALAQGLASQGEAIRDGMTRLAQAVDRQTEVQMAPTRLVRDEKGRPVSSEKVLG